MRNPTSSNKNKQGLIFCTNCMKTTHTKDRCYYLIGFPTREHCNIKGPGHTKRRCRYLNDRTDWAHNQMRTSRCNSKQGRLESNVKTLRKPNQKRISMLSEGSNSALRSSSPCKEVSKDNHDSAALDTILPDDLMEKIFSFLPMTSIIRGTAVCKRWYDAMRARKRDSWIGTRVQKPWYCIFDDKNRVSASYSYDPTSQIWYKLLFPFTLLHHKGIISSSRGLLCFVDFAEYCIFVHNPITKETEQLPKLGDQGPYKHYLKALSISVDQMFPYNYIVAAVKIRIYGCSWEHSALTIQIYESESKRWVTRVREDFPGWDGKNDCVICDKVLYFLVHWPGVHNRRVGLIMYDLSTSGEASTSLMSTLRPLPTWISWARLINMNDRVIVVGGNLRDSHGYEKMGIWELHKRSVWEEIDRVPYEFITRLSEFAFGQNYICRGGEGLIYIHEIHNPDLLTFDMTTKKWGWVSRFSVTKKSAERFYHGFCFEPRLDVSP